MYFGVFLPSLIINTSQYSVQDHQGSIHWRMRMQAHYSNCKGPSEEFPARYKEVHTGRHYGRITGGRSSSYCYCSTAPSGTELEICTMAGKWSGEPPRHQYVAKEKGSAKSWQQVREKANISRVKTHDSQVDSMAICCVILPACQWCLFQFK